MSRAPHGAGSVGGAPWDAIVMAGGLAVVAAAAWHWQASVQHRQRVPALTESWERAQEQFPLPTTLLSAMDSSGTGRPRESLAAVVKANPFSPQRRTVLPAAPPGGAGGSGGSPSAPAAALVYKGRVSLGTIQRAIVEDGTAKKTYFLQVGQEVAGYKVLDISESEVVLSDSKSQDKLVLRLTPRP